MCAGVNRFSFSYHGIGKHDAFTGVVGSEERIRNAIEWTASERRNNPDLYVKVGTLFDGNNIESVGKLLDYTENLDLDLYIELLDNDLPIFSNCEMRKEKNTLSIQKALKEFETWRKNGRRILMDDQAYQFMKLYFTNPQSIKGCCPLGKTDLYIENNGNVRSGCWVLPPVGNVNEQALVDIINGDNYKENITKMLNRECSGCSCGYIMQSKFLEYTGENT